MMLGLLRRPVVALPALGLVRQRPVVAVSTRLFASRKHKKYVKFAKGYVGRANRCFRMAIQRVEKAWLTAFKGRKQKKRSMRRLWIARINAGSRLYGVPYNRLIPGLQASQIDLNRNVLANLAMTEPLSFKSVLDVTCKLDPYLSRRHIAPPLTPQQADIRALLAEVDALDDTGVDWDNVNQDFQELPALPADFVDDQDSSSSK